MQCMPIQRSGFTLNKDEALGKGTAYYIFKEADISYTIDGSHFAAKNGRLGMPVVSASAADLQRIAEDYIHTCDTVWNIMESFLHGARITFPSPKSAYTVYMRILKHLDAHLNAMRTVVSYSPPDVEDLRNLAEFATMVRPMALNYDPNIDEMHKGDAMGKHLPVRPSFTIMDMVKVQTTVTAPKSVKKMDAIERYLDSLNSKS